MSAIPITVTGTIATEPTARTLPTGRACASFRLAVNHWRVDRGTGEFINDGTSWFGIDCYGDLASNSSMSLGKGTAVIVTGSLRNREWETEERSGVAPTVVADHIGPDLRYGTAHYRRAKGQDRTENQSSKASEDTGTAESDGWEGLGSPSAAEVATAARTTGAGERASSDADTSVAEGEASAAESDGADQEGTGSSAATGDNDGPSADDTAIAAVTAAAAAPF